VAALTNLRGIRNSLAGWFFVRSTKFYQNVQDVNELWRVSIIAKSLGLDYVDTIYQLNQKHVTMIKIRCQHNASGIVGARLSLAPTIPLATHLLTSSCNLAHFAEEKREKVCQTKGRYDYNAYKRCASK